MAERLPMIRIAPDTVLDASVQPQASQGLLQAAYPQAAIEQWLPDAEASVEGVAHTPGTAGGASGLSWWQRWTGLGGRKLPPVWRNTDVPAGHAGLIWSNMSLYLQSDPESVFQSWRRVLRPDGFVMFSTLGTGSLPELRRIYADMGWGPAHGPLLDMHDLGDMMVHAGLADPVMDQESLTLRYADPKRLWADLRAWGRNAAPDRHPGWRTPAWRQRLEDALVASADGQGRFSVTLELVYGHAVQAPDKGPAVSAETAVDLASMRKMLKTPRR
jgi:malonyl-CoA O-methyltransferase